MENIRTKLQRARRVIVKVGSQALAEDESLIPALAADVASLVQLGKRVVVVTSGAVALGWKKLGYSKRPKEIGRLQASAAAGQGVLLGRYSTCFADHGLGVAQVLLTHSDLSRRHRVNNARAALGELIDAGLVPIINENDTVSTEEICFGDNDRLAAMVAPLVEADLVVFLTNVAGVLDARGRRISRFGANKRVHQLDLESTHGKGGISGKVQAARMACRCGAHVVVAGASTKRVLQRIVEGRDVGTLFEPTGSALRARKHWIAYTLRPRGTVIIDNGARIAMESGRRSLLSIGVVGVRGKFEPGDAIKVVSADEHEVARGLSGLSSERVAAISGACRDLSVGVDADEPAEIVIHKDDLVLMT